MDRNPNMQPSSTGNSQTPVPVANLPQVPPGNNGQGEGIHSLEILLIKNNYFLRQEELELTCSHLRLETGFGQGGHKDMGQSFTVDERNPKKNKPLKITELPPSSFE